MDSFPKGFNLQSLKKQGLTTTQTEQEKKEQQLLYSTSCMRKFIHDNLSLAKSLPLSLTYDVDVPDLDKVMWTLKFELLCIGFDVTYQRKSRPDPGSRDYDIYVDLVISELN